MFKKILFVVIFLAFLVRFWGVKPGFPPYHPDEPQIYSRALLIIQGKEESLGYWGYPALVPLIHALIYKVFFIPATMLLKFMTNPKIFFDDSFNLNNFLANEVYGKGEINVLYWGRTVNAFLGAVTVLLTFILGKKLFDKKIGILSALFLAFNFKHVLASHFALVDVANGLFLILAIISSIDILRSDSKKNYILAGLFSGMSMSVKLSPFALAAPFGAEFLKFIQAKRIKVPKTIGYILLTVIISSLAVLIINVFHLSHLDALQKDFDTLNKRYAVGSFKIVPFPYSNFFTETIPGYLSVFCLIGFIVAVFKKFKSTLITLLPIALFFFALTFYSVGGVYSRNLIAFIPMFLILAAVGIVTLFKKDYVLWPVVFLMLVVPVSKIITLNRAFVQPWNMDRVKTSLNSEFNGKNIAATPWFAAYFQNNNIKFTDFGINANFTRRELEKTGVDYVLVDTDAFQGDLVFWMSFRGREAIWDFSQKDIIYSTFAASATKDLLAFRLIDYVKPPLVPETNFFLVKLPHFDKNFKGRVIYGEEFEKDSNWTIKSSRRETISNTGYVRDKICQSNGCIKIGNIGPHDSSVSYLTSIGTPRFFSYGSKPIDLEPGYIYRISVDAWADINIDEKEKDGFFKVELYETWNDGLLDRPGKLVFVSNRITGKALQKSKLDVYFHMPDGYRYATVSFQRNANRPNNFYFDNLIIEKSDTKSKDVEYKDFPEEYVLIDSIL